MLTRRPYRIIPRLITQPTWGGDYIINKKHFISSTPFPHIGQSYELCDGSLLEDPASEHTDGVYEIADSDGNVLTKTSTTVLPQPLSDIVAQDPENIIGKSVWERFGRMPLLIKLTQAFANSFQIHIKAGTIHPRYKPKPESWYFLHDGLITCGLIAQCNLQEYKRLCLEISSHMHTVSDQLISGTISKGEALHNAHLFISQHDPHTMVNKHTIRADTVVDISAGGIHHSWEADKAQYPDGNVLYEVQIDEKDPVSTIRAFDQGKFKEDGSLRPLQIDDYFHLIDTSREANDLTRHMYTPKDDTLLSTSYYSLSKYVIEEVKDISMTSSFHHVFVLEGEVKISGPEGEVTLSEAQSCFIPFFCAKYMASSINSTPSTILVTSIEK